jgi:hypothetical protein
VLQRCSFFVLLVKNQNSLHIIFYTIIELRPTPCKLWLCISPVVQNALICINYARFQVPVPGSGSCIAVSLYRFLVVAKQKYPISSTKKSLTTERFIRLVPNLTTMLINNKGTKEFSRFRFSVLFFNLEASLQPLILAQDKSSCLLYIKANTIAVKKCEHTFLLWTFEMRNMIFWELLS